MAKKAKSGWVSRIVGHDRVDPSTLTGNPLNHRRHPQQQRDIVSSSIKELGFIKSVIVNRTTGLIVDGHERVWQALNAQENGQKVLIDVEYVELTEAEERKALAILDASSELATVDIDVLGALLGDVQTDDMILSEFFASMLVDKRKEVIEDDVPDLPKKATTKLGDLWLLGNHRLVCGDSTQVASYAKLMNGKAAELFVTDPPYNVNYEGGTGLKIDGDHQSDTKFKQFLLDAFGQSFAVLKPGAAFYIWHADTEGLNFRAAVVGCGQQIRQCLIWVKDRFVMGRQDYHWQHEPCLTGEVVDTEDKHVPALYGWKDGGPHKWFSNRKQTTVLQFDRPAKSAEHPTMKPVKLLASLIENSSAPGYIVLDPFLGSGSTLIACEQLQRVCYGIELDPLYCDVIVKRWENLTGKKAARHDKKSKKQVT